MLSTLACVAFLVVQLVAHSGCDQTAFLVTPARLLVTLAGLPRFYAACKRRRWARRCLVLVAQSR